MRTVSQPSPLAATAARHCRHGHSAKSSGTTCLKGRTPARLPDLRFVEILWNWDLALAFQMLVALSQKSGTEGWMGNMLATRGAPWQRRIVMAWAQCAALRHNLLGSLRPKAEVRAWLHGPSQAALAPNAEIGPGKWLGSWIWTKGLPI